MCGEEGCGKCEDCCDGVHLGSACLHLRLNACAACSLCGDPGAEHIAGGWIIDKEAEIGIKGQRHTECTVCGEILASEEIPALPQPTVSFWQRIVDFFNMIITFFANLFK